MRLDSQWYASNSFCPLLQPLQFPLLPNPLFRQALNSTLPHRWQSWRPRSSPSSRNSARRWRTCPESSTARSSCCRRRYANRAEKSPSWTERRRKVTRVQCYRPQTAGPRAQTAPRWVRLVRLCVAVTVAVEVCLWFVFLRCTVLVSKFVIICVSTSICIIIIYFIHARLTWILFSWICWEIFTGYISKHFFLFSSLVLIFFVSSLIIVWDTWNMVWLLCVEQVD